MRRTRRVPTPTAATEASLASARPLLLEVFEEVGAAIPAVVLVAVLSRATSA
ncbi:MAG: hypothetical protein QM571_00310 [Micrococcaceae bacterium]